MNRIILFALSAAALAAQQPAISNANVRTVSAAGGLEPAVRAAAASQSGALWIGYSVARIPGDGESCCWNDGGRGCGLEGQRAAAVAKPGGPVMLEGPSHAVILLRAEAGQVGKIRVFTADCPLDGGGLPFVWLTGAKTAESVAMLMGYAANDAKSLSEPAVHGIAQHAGPEAAAALDKLATSGATEKLRKSAVFWLANSRGRTGYLTVARLAREDPSDKVREHCVFALTLSREPGAIPAIVRVAKEDKSPHVRGQALFWLAQKATKAQAAGAIQESLDKDPDTEVKKKAVFALTQMPAAEGVPMLIQVARANTNPAVRKQAMFWLGQSKDPRALRFFEDVLK